MLKAAWAEPLTPPWVARRLLHLPNHGPTSQGAPVPKGVRAEPLTSLWVARRSPHESEERAGVWDDSEAVA